MNRLALVLALALATPALAKPPLQTHTLEPTPDGWRLVGGQPLDVPGWDPRFQDRTAFLSLPQPVAVQVDARCDGHTLRDVRRFEILVAGERLILELSPRAWVGRAVALHPHAGDRRPLLRLQPGQRVDVLSQGEWVDVKIHGPRGGMTGRLPNSALERHIAVGDVEWENDPFDMQPTLPSVAPAEHPLELEPKSTLVLFDERLKPWHEVSPLAKVRVVGVHRERSGLAWVEVSGHGETLWAFARARDLEVFDPSETLPPRLAELTDRAVAQAAETARGAEGARQALRRITPGASD